MSNLIKLKIKLKSLAAESRIIRHEEKKRRGQNWGHTGAAFYRHRMDVVRPEARATHIAYGFLKGLKYSQIESNPKTSPNWKRVESMVAKYSYGKKDLTAWSHGDVQKVA